MSDDEKKDSDITEFLRDYIRLEKEMHNIEVFMTFTLDRLNNYKNEASRIVELSRNDNPNYNILTRRLSILINEVDVIVSRMNIKWRKMFSDEETHTFVRINCEAEYIKPEKLFIRDLALTTLSTINTLQRIIRTGGFHMFKRYERFVGSWNYYQSIVVLSLDRKCSIL